MSVDTTTKTGFVFTGKHMAIVMGLFFGTIIAVNFTMAWYAHSSWSGLVVENTYVASQEFNEKAALARTIEASGVRGTLDVKKDAIRYQLTDAKADSVIADTVTLRFRRPVGDKQDFELQMKPAGAGLFEATHPVPPGQWIVESEALRGKDIVMHEAVRILVDGEK